MYFWSGIFPGLHLVILSSYRILHEENTSDFDIQYTDISFYGSCFWVMNSFLSSVSWCFLAYLSAKKVLML